jgi:hypothetical protein
LGDKKVTIHRILIAAFFTLSFSAITTQPVLAQDGTPPHGFPQLKAWKTADEITFGGGIDAVVAKNPVGAPAGLNLLMTGAHGALYVNLGPSLSDKLKQVLTPGQSVQVTGIVQIFNGQNYILARELQLGDQKIEIRNSHGFLTHTASTANSNSTRVRTSQIGGAR